MIVQSQLSILSSICRIINTRGSQYIYNDIKLCVCSLSVRLRLFSLAEFKLLLSGDGNLRLL